MFIIKPVIITALTLFILAWLLPTISYGNAMTLILASVVLTVLQKVVRPLLGLVFLPINIITLGLFSWVLNVLILWLATFLVPGFKIEPMIVMGVEFNSFFTLLLVSFLIGLFQSGIRLIL